jgi:hypothetical protein
MDGGILSGPLLLGLAAASAGGSAASAVLSANAQKDNIEAQQRANRAAAIEQSKQLTSQAALERQKRAIERARQVGAIRVASGEAGLSISGSFEALQRQALIDEQIDRKILATNLNNAIKRVSSGAAQSNLALGGQRTNAVMAGITGGLTGFDAGLRIGSSVNTVTDTNE